MSRSKALILLTSCRPLAAKLAFQGVNIELDDEDRIALAGFNQVWLDGWLEDNELHRQVGLSYNDINALNFKAAMVQFDKMQRPHENMEQLD